MADLAAAMVDIGELLFPLDGDPPYVVEQLDPKAAAKRLDRATKVSGTSFEKPEKPLVVLVDRGSRREPIVMMHGYWFLRLLKRSEYDL